MNKYAVAFIAGCSLLSVLVAAYARTHPPFWNWDMLPYVAAAAELDGHGPVQCHDIAYADAKAHVPSPAYGQLIDPNNPYRAAMRTDATAFANQRPFYWIKPLYILLVWIFWKLGASLAWATVWPSVLAFLAMAVILLRWLGAYVPLAYSAVTVAVFAALPCVNEVAGLSTPDALSAALMIPGLMMLFAVGEPEFGIPLLILAIAARADNAIMAIIVLALQRWCVPERALTIPRTAIGMASMIATYLVVDHISCTHGWCVRPAHSFRARSLHPQLEDAHLTAGMYFNALRNGSEQLKFTWVLEFATAGVIATILGLSGKWRSAMRSPLRILAVVSAAVVIRYLLFPVPDDRALIPWYATIALTSVVLIHRIANGSTVTAPSPPSSG